MNGFIRQLSVDVVLWFLLAVCILQLPFYEYAENIISFYGIFLMVVGSLIIFTYQGAGKKLGEKPDYKPRGKLRKSYGAITSFVEIGIIASMGWYWVASGFLIATIGLIMSHSAAEDAYNDSH